MILICYAFTPYFTCDIYTLQQVLLQLANVVFVEGKKINKSVIWFNTVQLDFALCFVCWICLCSLFFLELFASGVTKEGIFMIPAYLILQALFVKRGWRSVGVAYQGHAQSKLNRHK